MTLLDEAFTLLDKATALEKSAANLNTSCESAGQGSSSSAYSDYYSLLEQAASKYHEACYLMKRHVNVGRNISSSGENSSDVTKMRRLLIAKIEQYERYAEELQTKVKEHKIQYNENRGAHKSIQESRLESGSKQPTDGMDMGFVLEKNVTPNSSWENKHKAQLETSRNRTQSKHDVSVSSDASVQAAGKASILLSAAIKLDESGNVSKAKEQYLAAAKNYLDAVKILSENHSNADLIASLKHKVQLALDRVEKLKKIENTRGKKQPDCDEINRKLASLQIAYKEERINGVTKPDCDDINRKLASMPPTHEETLSPYEVEVLKQSSLISSGLFLPWCDEEVKIYDFSPSSPWVDPDGMLTLSEKQKQKFRKWARPSEIIHMKRHASRDIKMIHSITPFTIRQYCVSDCSFVAGLCIAAAYERRFKNRIISSLIYPQDADGYPIYNPHGVYMVKLWLNGVARRVLVDDFLPVDEKGKLLCSHTDCRLRKSKRRVISDDSPLELWVPILEKAYMKLCGGYNFPGSNSGVDMFSLSGWIPERIFFPENSSNIKDFETPIERAWERLYSANSYGDCLITLSTSKELTEEMAAEVGLFTDHAYAVLNVIQTCNGTRLLQLKNPWAADGWKGKFSSNDKTSWSDPDFCSEVGYNASFPMDDKDDGVFYISWSDVTIYFRNLHLSWNPSLFRHKTTMHGCWKKDVGPADDSFNVGENPQYIVNLSKNAIQSQATLWILLSRHVTKQEQEGGEVVDFLTLHIHRMNSKQVDRIYYPLDRSVLTGPYTNNPHILIRYDVVNEADKSLALVLSQYQKSNDSCYTISCYCTEKIKLSESVDPLPKCRVLNGSWELRGSSKHHSALGIGTAGGSPGKGSFGSNPQWTLDVANDTMIQLKCMANKTLAVNVILIQTGTSTQASSDMPKGKRIHHIYETPIIDSGDYRYGFVVTKRTLLSAGSYTLIASTFEVGEEGRFILHVMSDKKIGIFAIK